MNPLQFFNAFEEIAEANLSGFEENCPDVKKVIFY